MNSQNRTYKVRQRLTTKTKTTKTEAQQKLRSQMVVLLCVVCVHVCLVCEWENVGEERVTNQLIDLSAINISVF